jgi:hypothetical protein
MDAPGCELCIPGHRAFATLDTLLVRASTGPTAASRPRGREDAVETRCTDAELSRFARFVAICRLGHIGSDVRESKPSCRERRRIGSLGKRDPSPGNGLRAPHHGQNVRPHAAFARADLP